MSHGNKNDTDNIIPAYNIHPGEDLKDELEARGIKQKELAEAIKVQPNFVSEIINGKRNITPQLALKLQAALGINAAFWLGLQADYDLNLIRLNNKDQFKTIKRIKGQRKKEMELT